MRIVESEPFDAYGASECDQFCGSGVVRGQFGECAGSTEDS
jgi:hypothetical protein